MRRRHPMICSKKFCVPSNAQLVLLTRHTTRKGNTYNAVPRRASLQSSHQHVDLIILVEHVTIQESQTLVCHISLICGRLHKPQRGVQHRVPCRHTTQGYRGVSMINNRLFESNVHDAPNGLSLRQRHGRGKAARLLVAVLSTLRNSLYSIRLVSLERNLSIISFNWSLSGLKSTAARMICTISSSLMSPLLFASNNKKALFNATSCFSVSCLASISRPIKPAKDGIHSRDTTTFLMRRAPDQRRSK